jgi:hypothetical protein
MTWFTVEAFVGVISTILSAIGFLLRALEFTFLAILRGARWLWDRFRL